MYITLDDETVRKYSIELIAFSEGGYFVSLIEQDPSGHGRSVGKGTFFVAGFEDLCDKLAAMLVADKLEKS